MLSMMDFLGIFSYKNSVISGVDGSALMCFIFKASRDFLGTSLNPERPACPCLLASKELQRNLASSLSTSGHIQG